MDFLDTCKKFGGVELKKKKKRNESTLWSPYNLSVLYTIISNWPISSVG